MAMDMGGSNVRVTKYQLKGNGLLEIVKEVRRAFPESYMMGTADQVFGFLAKCVQDVLPNQPIYYCRVDQRVFSVRMHRKRSCSHAR